MRLIDLSIPTENDVPADPPHMKLHIDYTSHLEGGEEIAALFPGLSADDLPDRMGWAVEWVTLSTHHGTHVDAPWHYHPTMNGGEPSSTIDELPLEWFFQPGVKLDFRNLPAGHLVSAEEIDEELARIGHQLSPLEIVVMNTGAGARYGQPDYVDSGCGFGREATLHLAAAGVRVVGTDGWSWDAPFSATAARFAQERDPSIIWEGHKAGMEVGYCQIEKMHNLELLPSSGFRIACFPAKIRGGSAGWTRAVAILEE